MGRWSRRGLLAGALGLAGGAQPVPAAQAGEFRPEELAQMESAAEQLMAARRVPALSVAFAKDERLVYARAFGTARAAEAATPRHLFRIASLSKPLTATAVMSLVEKKKLQLSDRVFGPDGILGTAYGGPPYTPGVDEITVDHLLTHTAGGWGNNRRDPMFLDRRMEHAELIRYTLANHPLDFPPGRHYAYSNFGYCLLGRILERAGGASFAAVVRKEVLDRCGIMGMEIAGNTLAERRPLEVEYSGQDGEDPYRMRVDRMDAHGGWLANPTDLVRFLVRVDQFPKVPDLLSAASLATMFRPTEAEGGTNYARGWAVNSRPNHWHTGSLPGTTTVMVRTSGGLCWALLANTRAPGMDVALDRLAWEMVGKITAWPTRDLF